MKRSIIIYSMTILVVFIAALNLQAVIVNGIACKVNDSIITVNEFEVAYQTELNKSLVMGKAPPGKKKVMDMLVENLLIKEEANRRGIVVTDEEVDGILDKIKSDNRLSDEKFLEELKREGLTVQDLKKQYRMNLLQNRLISQMISDAGYKVSEGEVSKFYSNPKNKKFFVLPSVIKISQIFIKVPGGLSFKDQIELKKKVNQIFEEAKKFSDFRELVNKYSDDQNKNKNQGKMGSFTMKQLAMWINPDNAGLLFSLKKGDISLPIRLSDGYYIFKIDDKLDKRILSIKEAHDQIRNYLLKKRGSDFFNQWLAEKKKNSYIQYMIEVE